MNRAEHCRRKLGVSYAVAARVCGVHRQTWIKWERGEREPDNAAARLMEILEILAERGLLEETLAPLCVSVDEI